MISLSCQSNLINLLLLYVQHPGCSHPVQRDHHTTDDVQHLRVPSGPCLPAAGAFQGLDGIRCHLPDPQHLSALLDGGTCSHTQRNMALIWNGCLYDNSYIFP